MRFADEFADPRELEIAEADKQPSKIEIDTARLLVDQLVSSFEPNAYENSYRAAVLGVIEQKARGERIQAPQSQEQTGEGELLSALRASLEEGHARKRRRPTSVKSQPSKPQPSDKAPRPSGGTSGSSVKAPRSSDGTSRSSVKAPRSPGGASRSAKGATPARRRTRGED
jgi:hypothetical protein